MDEAARYFIEGVRFDPWFAIEQALPDGLDLAGLQELRPTVYALLDALDLTLDEANNRAFGRHRPPHCPDRALAAGQPLERWRDFRQSG